MTNYWLAGYTPEIVDQYRAEIPQDLPAKPEAQKEALEILKEWYEEGLIGEDEYGREKSRILSEL